MIRKRTTLLAVNSLKSSSPKVRSSSSINRSLDSIKPLTLSKNITTNATQVSSDFNINPSENEDYPQYRTNPSLYNGDQNGVESHHSPVGQNGNYGGIDRQSYAGSPQQSRNGWYNGSYSRGDTGYQGSVNGNYNPNVGQFRQGAGDSYTSNVVTNHQNVTSSPIPIGAFGNAYAGHFQHHRGGNYRQSEDVGVQTQNCYYINNGQNFLRNQYGGGGNYSNLNTFQQAQPNPNYLGNQGTYQQNNGYLRSSNGYQWSSNGIADNSVGNYQPNANNYNNVGYNTNGASKYNASGTYNQYASINPEVSNRVTVEAFEGNRYRGASKNNVTNTYNQFASIKPQVSNRDTVEAFEGNRYRGASKNNVSDTYTQFAPMKTKVSNRDTIKAFEGNQDRGTSINNGSDTYTPFAPMKTKFSSEDTVEAFEGNQYRGTVEEFDGFCKEGKVKEALEVLQLLRKRQINVDLSQYLYLVQTCGEAKALEEAKSVHKLITKSISPLEVSTYNEILEMYLKCESMDDASEVFDSMPVRNLTSWVIMITWHTKNELPQEAIDLFEEFKKSDLKPDGKIFIGVFSAFSVLGEIEEGMLHFEKMVNEYNIIPTMKHYVSVVDMLGNAGYTDEALEFIEKMPIEPSIDIYETLMNVCWIQGNLELGDRCAEIVDQLDPTRLSDQSRKGLIPMKPSDIAKGKETKKLASQNLLQVKSRVHEYRAGDTSHPENDRIYTLLRGLRQQMKEVGYIPDTRFVLHDVDQESKEEALLSHSERLAVSYGLFTTPARQPIRVIKNLRVCGDCHNAIKIISKLVGRQLIMRDAKRFHHFEDGVCSCRDYW